MYMYHVRYLAEKIFFQQICVDWISLILYERIHFLEHMYFKQDSRRCT